MLIKTQLVRSKYEVFKELEVIPAKSCCKTYLN